mgnify:CR=1 FL=1
MNTRISPSIKLSHNGVTFEIYIYHVIENVYEVVFSNGEFMTVVNKSDNLHDAMEFLDAVSIPFIMAQYKIQTVFQ